MTPHMLQFHKKGLLKDACEGWKMRSQSVNGRMVAGQGRSWSSETNIKFNIIGEIALC